MQNLKTIKLIEKIRNTDIFETLKNTKNYFSANIAIKALGFIYIPIFTRLFTQEDYGIVAVFSSYVGIIAVILSLNSYTAVSRYYYEKTEDFDSFLGTTVLFVGVILSVLVPCYILFLKPLGVFMKLPGALPLYLLLAAVFSIIASIYNQIIVPRKESKKYARINVLKTYIGFGISVLLVYSLKDARYLGKIWATLLVGSGFSVYFLINIFREARISWNRDHIKYILSYSVPLLPYHLSGIILAQFDRIMINKMIDASAAGLYSLGYEVGMILSIVIGSTQMALMPDFFRFLNRGEYKRLDSLVKKVFSIIIVSAFGLILFSREIVIVLADKKFHAALGVVPIVVIGYVFFAMFTIYGMYIGYAKKTIYSSVVVLTAGITNIVLNLIFIPRYGYVAGAYTTVVSYFIMFLLAWFFARIVLKQKTTPLWIVWKPTIITFASIGVVILVSGLKLPFVAMFVIKLALLTIFTVLIFQKEITVLYNKMKA